MKILVVGMGSIGRRHASCLQQQAGVELAVLRTAKGTLKERTPFKEFHGIKEALSFGPDGVIVANPTALHVSTALPFLERGIKVLIEKPVAHSVSDAEKLASFASQIRVAYCLRFLPLTAVLKKIIETEKVYKLGFRRSYYLPNWHPYADYRSEYTARKDLGGGVIRTMSHEIDLMHYFLGCPVEVVGAVDKISALDIDTDDYAFFTCKMSRGARVNFELDFFSPANVNAGELFTEKGKYSWNTTDLYFTSYRETVGSKINEIGMFDFEAMYHGQVSDFIRFVNKGVSANSTYEDSLNVMRVIGAVEKAD
jgi:predicted dehydrogenase